MILLQKMHHLVTYAIKLKIILFITKFFLMIYFLEVTETISVGFFEKAAYLAIS